MLCYWSMLIMYWYNSASLPLPSKLNLRKNSIDLSQNLVLELVFNLLRWRRKFGLLGTLFAFIMWALLIPCWKSLMLDTANMMKSCDLWLYALVCGKSGMTCYHYTWVELTLVHKNILQQTKQNFLSELNWGKTPIALRW